jgi:hypothetical protein
MNKIQAGDVLLYQSVEDGEINVEDGIVEMTKSFDTMIYLILMGPNEGDDGTAATEKQQWMGNEGETPEHRIRGRFHQFLEGVPITSANLLDMQAAAVEDITDGFGDLLESVQCTVSASSSHAVQVSGNLTLTTGAVVPYRLELFA